MLIKIPLKQHVGAPCKPIVKLAENVKRGQLIAIPDGLGANIHASLSGEVIEINDMITIKASDINEKDYIKLDDDLSNLDLIKEAGVVGAGGAGFPTGIKLSTKIKDGVVIINAAECEPILSHNIVYLEENPRVIYEAAKILIDIVSAKRAVLAIKAKHKKAFLNFKNLLKVNDNISLYILPDMYPSGDERVIVREVLSEILAPGELPSKYNSVVVNLETSKNIYRACIDKMPVITKDITVSGRLKDKQKEVFLDVAIGSSFEDYVNKLGGRDKYSGESVIGGAFTGKRAGDDPIVSKTSGALLVAIEFPIDKEKFGALECECGAGYQRLSEIVESMGGELVASEKCKRMIEVGGRFRCEKPGECPGQAETVMKLKKQGAKSIIVGT